MEYNVPKKYQSYKGWEFEVNRSGAIGFSKATFSIWCSPDWDDNEGTIDIAVTNWDDGQETALKSIAYPKPFSWDFWFETVKPYLDRYDERMPTEGLETCPHGFITRTCKQCKGA